MMQLGKSNFPRLGTFEVYFRGQRVFSKLLEGRWPNSNIIAGKIRNIIDGVVVVQKGDLRNEYEPRAFTANARSRSAKNFQGQKVNDLLKSKKSEAQFLAFEIKKQKTMKFEENYHQGSLKKNSSSESPGKKSQTEKKSPNKKSPIKKLPSEGRLGQEEPVKDQKIEQVKHMQTIVKREDNKEEADQRLVLIQKKLKEEAEKFSSFSSVFMVEEAKKVRLETGEERKFGRKKMEDKKFEEKIAEDKKLEEKIAEDMKFEEKKAEDKKLEEKKAEEKRVEREKLEQKASEEKVLEESKKKSLENEEKEKNLAAPVAEPVKVQSLAIEYFKEQAITKTFTIPLQSGIETFKKLPFMNNADTAKDLLVEVSHPGLIRLENPQFTIPANTKALIKFVCLSRSSLNTTVYILVKLDGKCMENYELILEYS